MPKCALITGITGQDGSLLAELLLEKGYEVHGIKRMSSLPNTERVDHLYQEPHEEHRRFFLHYGDLLDAMGLARVIREAMPDEVYHLAAQSHVAVSFQNPVYTADVDALGTLRLLEAIRVNKMEKRIRFYQASTSELYGLVQEVPQRESTPFYPRSPYAVAKLYAYWITVNYREAYGMYACNGILFNHESSRRGITFVTRKITQGIAKLLARKQKCIYLGNLQSKRDWGHARDYVEAQWLMLQQDQPKDYVIATGEQYSVAQFVERAFQEVGVEIEWRGKGAECQGVAHVKGGVAGHLDGRAVVSVDPRYFRPAEVDTLLGDSTLARRELGWSPRWSFAELVSEMVRADLASCGLALQVEKPPTSHVS